MSETMKTILTRRSTRNYKPDMIPKEIIDEILRAGTYAASGSGKQSPIIITVTNRRTPLFKELL